MSNETPNRIALLFGAGISKAANLPDTSSITAKILSGDGVYRVGDGAGQRYRIGTPPNPKGDCTNDYLARVVLLLKLVKSEADIYYFLDKEVNYEQLFFMAQQLLGSLDFTEDNPVVHQFAKHLEARMGHLLSEDPFTEGLTRRAFAPTRKMRYRHDIGTMTKLARETCNYIRDVACGMISRAPGDLSYFQWLAEAAVDSDVGHKTFFTLNYDTLVEQFFRSRGVLLIDGFGPQVEAEGIYYFNASVYEDTSRPHLVKLHGSLDWFANRRIADNADQPALIVRPANEDKFKEYAEKDAPIVLVGTHNKPRNYATPQFEEQHAQLRIGLNKAIRLVVCGYSFGDQAINSRLLLWLLQRAERRMTVIHPNIAQCQLDAHPAFGRVWGEFMKRGQLRVIESRMEDMTWHTVKGSLR